MTDAQIEQARRNADLASDRARDGALQDDERVIVLFEATRRELNHYHMTRSITLLEPRLYRAILDALYRKEEVWRLPWKGWTARNHRIDGAPTLGISPEHVQRKIDMPGLTMVRVLVVPVEEP
ncbi:MAG TPA: hypothetical protein VJL07_02795 [Dehalococcoidia bacterium]|nr:hypothetical protein [Dehalococcoidia bacterium]